MSVDTPPPTSSKRTAESTFSERENAHAQSPATTWGQRILQSLVRSGWIVLIYVLSIGPLYWQWYAARYAAGPRFFAAFFEPLVVLAELIPPFGEWLDWYVGLWIS